MMSCIECGDRALHWQPLCRLHAEEPIPMSTTLIVKRPCLCTRGLCNHEEREVTVRVQGFVADVSGEWWSEVERVLGRDGKPFQLQLAEMVDAVSELCVEAERRRAPRLPFVPEVA